jgi:hypothetical protein
VTKNPFLNAGAATAYIVLVVSVMFFGTQHVKGPDTILAPLVMISLLTLSAAVMAYIFMYTPLTLYIDGKKKEAARLFLHTIGAFSVITAIFLTVLFSGIFS